MSKPQDFKPGQSGNPKGRPKKGNSWKDVLSEAMEAEHDIGGEKKTLKQIITEVLSKKAVKGDLKAIDMLMDRIDGKPKMFVEENSTQTVRTVQIDPEQFKEIKKEVEENL